MRRFIAGASCPKCRTADSLYFDVEIGENTVFCSDCEYTDTRGSEDQAATQPGVSENDSDFVKVTLIDTLESRS